MSVLLFAGAAQFAGIGYVVAGLGWGPILVLTALLNARHLLYAAALAPSLRGIPTRRRALMAYVLTDEAFALAAAHFRRLGCADERGYWIAALGAVFVPWNLATLAGVLLGGTIPDPGRLGLDVVFPAAMGGLAVGLVAGRREFAAACAGIAAGVAVALVAGPAPGILAGGLLGPLAALAIPERAGGRAVPSAGAGAAAP